MELVFPEEEMFHHEVHKSILGDLHVEAREPRRQYVMLGVQEEVWRDGHLKCLLSDSVSDLIDFEVAECIFIDAPLGEDEGPIRRGENGHVDVPHLRMVASHDP